MRVALRLLNELSSMAMESNYRCLCPAVDFSRLLYNEMDCVCYNVEYYIKYDPMYPKLSSLADKSLIESCFKNELNEIRGIWRSYGKKVFT